MRALEARRECLESRAQPSLGLVEPDLEHDGDLGDGVTGQPCERDRLAVGGRHRSERLRRRLAHRQQDGVRGQPAGVRHVLLRHANRVGDHPLGDVRCAVLVGCGRRCRTVDVGKMIEDRTSPSRGSPSDACHSRKLERGVVPRIAQRDDLEPAWRISHGRTITACDPASIQEGTMSPRPLRAPVLAVALVAVVALSGVIAAPAGAVATVNGSVGPGFTISLKRKGKKVKTLRPITYRFRITDKADIHNFHLRGPGVNKVLTSVDFTGTKSVSVKLRKGTYRYVCDPHSDEMKGSFKVR
jgi:hypothetical protein